MFSKSIGALNASNNSLEAFPKTPCLVKIVAYSGISSETLAQYLAELSRNRIKAEKADQLKQAASNSNALLGKNRRVFWKDLIQYGYNFSFEVARCTY
jgi:hypothetical protein